MRAWQSYLLHIFFFVDIQRDLVGYLSVFYCCFGMEQRFQDFLPIAESKQHGDASQHGDTHNGKYEIQIHRITLLFLGRWVHGKCNPLTCWTEHGFSCKKSYCCRITKDAQPLLPEIFLLFYFNIDTI